MSKHIKEIDETIVEFTARIPQYLVDEIDDEGKKQDRKRNPQLIRLLKERYGYVDEAEAAA